MIDFRYHLVSIIAIFFALAAGIALGAGPLKAGVDETLGEQTAQLREENQQLRDELAAGQASAEYRDSFATAVTPQLVRDRLEDRRVVVVSMPGTDSDQVGELREILGQAGASVTGTVQVEPTWTDAESAQVMDTLATELVSSGTTLPEGDGYDRGAAVLAGALLDAGETSNPSDNAAAVAAFAEAGLVSVEGQAAPAAQLAVAVAGPPVTDEAERRSASLVSLVGALDRAGNGVVVAGAPEAAAEGGLLAAVRDGDLVDAASTVDVAHTPSGRIATVWALQEQAGDGAGHYGSVGSTDGPLPTDPGGAATPSARG